MAGSCAFFGFAATLQTSYCSTIRCGSDGPGKTERRSVRGRGKGWSSTTVIVIPYSSLKYMEHSGQPCYDFGSVIDNSRNIEMFRIVLSLKSYFLYANV